MRTLLLPLLLIACAEPEGTYPNECLDNIDNDEDGVVDCEDEDCASSEECAEGGSDPWDSGGTGGYDNVQACEDWLDAVSCGEYDFADSVDCSDYADYDCDLAPYFQCLLENSYCDEKTGVLDMEDWSKCNHLVGCYEPY